MPENNEDRPKKKSNAALKAVIILLVVALAAVIAGYALSVYYPGLLPFGRGRDVRPVASTPQPTPVLTPAPTEPATSLAPVTEMPAEPEKAGEESQAQDSTAVKPEPSPADTKIGAEAAAKAALEHAKARPEKADVTSVRLNRGEDMSLYEVSFTYNDYLYRYEVDALSGRIEGWEKLSKTVLALRPEPVESPAAQSSSAPAAGSTVLIGEEKAKELAMGHAALDPEDVKSSNCRIEAEGLKLVYDIELYTSLQEYEYEIDAVTGQILSFSMDKLKAR